MRAPLGTLGQGTQLTVLLAMLCPHLLRRFLALTSTTDLRIAKAISDPLVFNRLVLLVLQAPGRYSWHVFALLYAWLAQS
jgi:hypothetical protein